jgi:hypothetical protein
MSPEAGDSSVRIETQPQAISVKIISAHLESYAKERRSVVELTVRAAVLKRLGSLELFRAIIRPKREG